MRDIRIKRALVVALLLSLLPLLVYPMIREGSHASVDEYANWLRGQFEFEDVSIDVVDQAIEVARQADSSNLSTFLQTFVEAYNTFTGAGRLSATDHVFLGAFQFHWLQFVNIALTPHWILKSAQPRSTLLSERSAPVLKTTLSKLLIAPLAENGLVERVEGDFSPYSMIATAINPRAP